MPTRQVGCHKIPRWNKNWWCIIEVLNRNKPSLLSKYAHLCFFEVNEPKRVGAIRWDYDQTGLLNHLSQCSSKFHFPSIKDEVYQLMKQGILNGFTDKIFGRLGELEADARKWKFASYVLLLEFVKTASIKYSCKKC